MSARTEKARTASARSARARRAHGFTLGEMVVVAALTTVVLSSIVPVADTLLRHQTLATDYAEDLAQGTRVADRIAREIRGAPERLVKSPATGKLALEEELLLREATQGAVPGRSVGAYRRLAVSPAGRAVLERWSATGQLVGREDLGRVHALSFAKEPSPGSHLVSFDVALPRRTEGARPAFLSSSALVNGESGP